MEDIFEYTKETRKSLFENPPRNSPSYDVDPKAVWKYYMRNYGYGLGKRGGLKELPTTKDIHGVITALYSSWFMRLELSNPKRPNVDAKEFLSWITSAVDDSDKPAISPVD